MAADTQHALLGSAKLAICRAGPGSAAQAQGGALVVSDGGQNAGLQRCIIVCSERIVASLCLKKTLVCDLPTVFV